MFDDLVEKWLALSREMARSGWNLVVAFFLRHVFQRRIDLRTSPTPTAA
jgi:hypothetical protein